jgi:hypothetical protein
MLSNSSLCAVSLLGLSVVAMGCDKGSSPPATLAQSRPSEPTPPAVKPIAPVTGPSIVRSVVEFVGACDASGAVPLDARRFAVGDDEDSVLRIYDAERGGPPLHIVNIADQLQLGNKKKGKKKRAPKKKRMKSPETDIEGATLLDDHAFWITSHALTKNGERDPRRFRFFATELPSEEDDLGMFGTPYQSLVTDMLADPRLVELGLAEASKRRPDEEGGLNVEGLTSMPNGQMLIGFRNPVPRRQAIALPLLNPKEVLSQQAAKFGPPLLLDLGGYGIRSLSFWHGSYLVIAGAIGDGTGSRLYKWDGAKQLQHIAVANFEGFNPEGFFTPEERADIMVLSDDGARSVGGQRCKDLKDSSEKHFRGVWLNLP